MHRLIRSAALAAAAAAAGCAGDLRYPGSADYQVATGFDARRPADVAVLPVAGDLPPATVEALREALRDRLLELRYAPFRLKEVDAKPSDYRPGGANPVLEIRITKWDDTGLFGDGTVRFSGEVRLFAGGSTEVLYRGTVQDVPVRASFVAHSMDDRATTLAQACKEAAERLLGGLPAKGDG
jgi:hypothetical protein